VGLERALKGSAAKRTRRRESAPFIMNEWSQVEAAVARYRAGGRDTWHPFRSVESGDYTTFRV
jgi:hypothetical protein